MQACHQLSELHLSALTSLTRLSIIDCPALFHVPLVDAAAAPVAAVQHAALLEFVHGAASRLPGLETLSNLRHLDLSSNASLRRLPGGLARLAQLRSFVMDGCRLDDCRGAEDGGLALGPLVGCEQLESVSVRDTWGFPETVALPEGIFRLVKLQVGTRGRRCPAWVFSLSVGAHAITLMRAPALRDFSGAM